MLSFSVSIETHRSIRHEARDSRGVTNGNLIAATLEIRMA
jgi:hypothetical protein